MKSSTEIIEFMKKYDINVVSEKDQQGDIINYIIYNDKKYSFICRYENNTEIVISYVNHRFNFNTCGRFSEYEKYNNLYNERKTIKLNSAIKKNILFNIAINEQLEAMCISEKEYYENKVKEFKERANEVKTKFPDAYITEYSGNIDVMLRSETKTSYPISFKLSMNIDKVTNIKINENLTVEQIMKIYEILK